MASLFGRPTVHAKVFGVPLSIFRMEHNWCQVHMTKTSFQLITTGSWALPISLPPGTPAQESVGLSLHPFTVSPEVCSTQQAPHRNGDWAILLLEPERLPFRGWLSATQR